MHPTDTTALNPKYGLTEDYRSRGDRQVTLIQAEHLPVIAALCGLDGVTPDMLRRNLVVSGISLRALKDKRFTIGSVQLLGTGECVPCSHMEESLGIGGYNAMRGHGGITARVLSEGRIHVGDTVKAVADQPA
jgi:MOSC domain-containing protein YiiM